MDDVEAAILATQRGELEAFERVVLHYERGLRGLLYGMCPRSIDADEIAHLAFVTAFRRLETYQTGTDFFAWLCAIARHLHLQALRSARREARKRQALAEDFVSEQLEDQPGDGRQVEALRQCLDELSAEQRSLIAMRYERDLPLAQLAEVVGTTLGAMKVRLFGLRRKLRDCVGHRLAGQQG